MSWKRVQVDLRDTLCPWRASRADATEETRECQVWARGQAWDGEAHLQGGKLADWLCNTISNQADVPSLLFEDTLKRLNGNFALVAQTSDETLAAVDKTRSIPLFYGQREKTLLLSNDADQVRRFVGSSRIDPLSEKEFLLTGYVTGPETLYPGVKQVQAGEQLSIRDTNDPKVRRARYFRFSHRDPVEGSQQHLSGLLDETLQRIVEGLVRSVGPRRIVVPLSGGLDSRAIVAMLKTIGTRDVLCFSYGRPGDWEAEISREVATRLGYEWHFVPYTRRHWRKWFQSEERQAYSRYGSGLVSCAHLQDWPAVWAMKQSGILQGDDVIVPGHTGDFVSGGHIPQDWTDRDQVSHKEVITAILKKHYKLWRWFPEQGGLEPALSERIADRLETDEIDTIDRAADAFERWEWQERQAKFIVNSVRVYEYWGYDWRLPLWDDEMMAYWAQVPLRWRIAQRLYRSYLEGELFAQFGIEGLYPKRPAGVIGRLIAKVDEFTNPNLGRHSLASQLWSWKEYQHSFGNGLRSRGFFRSPVSLYAPMLLRSLA